MSLMRASIQLGIDFEGARVSVKAFMFLLASLLPARFLRCLAQELLRMAIFWCYGGSLLSIPLLVDR